MRQIAGCDGSGARDEFAGALLNGAFLTLVAFGVLFVLEPRFDLDVTHQFYSVSGGFVGLTPMVGAVRSAFKFLYVVACLAAIAGLLFSFTSGRVIAGLGGAKWLYLCACLSIGPGLVCNLALKDEWGRARPRDVIEFGGEQRFTPPLTPTDQCKTNCSFTCGEASSIYMLFFALGLLARRRSGGIIATGILLGSIAGAIRVAQGAHFLSDVIFAGVTMAIVAAILHRILLGLFGIRLCFEIYKSLRGRGDPYLARRRSSQSEMA